MKKLKKKIQKQIIYKFYILFHENFNIQKAKIRATEGKILKMRNFGNSLGKRFCGSIRYIYLIVRTKPQKLKKKTFIIKLIL